MFRKFSCGILYHTVGLDFAPFLEACFTGWKSLTYMVFPHISPCTSPQSSSLHHAMGCDAEISISSAGNFALMGENYAREYFRPPKQPKTWKLQRQFNFYQWVLLYCFYLGGFWAAVFGKEHHREGSCQQLKILGVLCLFFSFQVSKSEFFQGNPVICR